MSREIDERVVQMEFDNKQFEKGVSETMKSLEAFKKSLEFKNVSPSAEAVVDSMGMIEKAVDSVKKSVGSLEDGFTKFGGMIKKKIKQDVVDKIVNMAEGAAGKVTNALFKGGAMEGKTKYEQKMTAIRTIMAATGLEANSVEKSLDHLVKYTDDTSYSFSEMINYVSQFTSYGLDLNESILMMEGIANAAADAGIGAGQAGSAMLNFSQAMAKGSMKLEDWKSLQQMAFVTKDFKEEVIKAAIAEGTLGKNGEILTKGVDKGVRVTTDNFDSLLHHGFMTTKVMGDVLKVYQDTSNELGRRAFDSAYEARSLTDALQAVKETIATGWSNSWQLIFGNVEEASEMFTDLASALQETVGGFADARNEILKGWKEGGGRNALIDTFRNLWTVLKDIGGMFSRAWEETFGRLDSSGLIKATEAVRDFVARIHEWLYTPTERGTLRITNLRRAIQGFFGVLKIAKEIVGGFFHFIGRILSFLMPDIDTIGDGLGDAGLAISKFADNLEKNGTIRKWFEDLANKVGPVVRAVGKLFYDVAHFIADAIMMIRDSEFYKTIKTWVVDKWNAVKNWFSTAWNDGGKTIGGFFEQIGLRILEGIKKIPLVGEWLGGFFEKIPEYWEKIKNWFSTAWRDGGKTIGGFFGQIGQRIADGIRKIPVVGEWIGGFFDKMPERWEAIKEWFSTAWKNGGETIGGFFGQIGEKIREWIAKIPHIGEGIANFFAGVPEWWENTKNWFATAWNNGGKTIGGFFQQLWIQIKDGIRNFIAGIPQWWEETKPKLVETWDKVKTWVADTFGKVIDWFRNLFGGTNKEIAKEAEKAAVTGGGSAGKKAAEAVEKSGGWLSGVVTFVKDWAKAFPIRAALYVAGAFAIIFLIWRIVKQIKKMFKMWMQIEQMKLGDTKSNINKSAALKWASIALAISAIAGSIWLITQINVDNLKTAAITMGIALATIVGLAWVIQKLDLKDALKSLGQAGLGLVAMAGSLFLIYLAILVFKNMKDEDFLSGVWKVGVVMGGLAIVMAIMSRFGGESGGVHWASILAMAATLLIIRGVVDQFAELAKNNWDGLLRGVIMLSVLMVAFGGAIALAGLASSESSQELKDGEWSKNKKGSPFWSMMAMILAMHVMIDAIKQFSAMSWEQIIRGALPVLLVMGLFAATLALVSSENRDFSAKRIIAMILASISFAIVIGVFVAALKLLESYDTEKLLTAGLILIGAFAVLVIAVAALGKLGLKTAIMGAIGLFFVMAGFAAGMIVVAAAMWVVVQIAAGAGPAFQSVMSSIGKALESFSDSSGKLEHNAMDWALDFILRVIEVFVKLGGINYEAVRGFSTNLYRLGAALYGYGRNTSRAGVDTMDKSLDFVERVLKLAKNLGKVKNVNNLAVVMAKLGSAIKLYYASIKGIDPNTAVNGSTVDMQAVASMISQLADNLPADDDMQRVIDYTENNSLTDFALGLTALGTAFTTLNQDMASVDRGNIQYAIDSLNAIKDLANAMPEDVVIETAFGTITKHRMTLSDFAVDIEAMASALTALSECFGPDSDMGKGNVEFAIKQIDALTDIYGDVLGKGTEHSKALTAIGEYLSAISVNSIWSNFVGSVGQLGKEMAQMSDELNNSEGFGKLEQADWDRLLGALGVVSTVYSAVMTVNGENSHALTGIGDWIGSWGTMVAWDNFVGNLGQFASGATDMVKALDMVTISEFSVEKYQTQIDVLSNVMAFVTKVYTDVQKATKVESSALTGLGDWLSAWGSAVAWSEFIKNLQPFAEGAGSVIDLLNGDTIQVSGPTDIAKYTPKIAVLAAAMGVVTKIYKDVQDANGGENSDALTGFGKWIEAWASQKNWTDFITSLSAFAGGAASIITFLNDDEVLQVSGSTDVKDYTDKIAVLAAAIGVVSETYKAVQDANGGENSDALTGIGEWIASWGSSNNWNNFIENLTAFATGASALLNAVVNIDTTNVTIEDYDDKIGVLQKAMDVVTSVYDTVFKTVGENDKALSGIGTWVSSFGIKRVWSNFVENLSGFAKGASALLVTVNDIGTEGTAVEDYDAKIDVLKNAMSVVTGVYSVVFEEFGKDNKALTSIGTWVSSFGVKRVWSNFVENLSGFAKGASALLTTVDSIELTDANSKKNYDDKIDILKNAMSVVTGVYDSVYSVYGENNDALTGIGSWVSSFGAANVWSNFVENLSGFAKGADDLLATVNGIDTSNVTIESYDDKISVLKNAMDVVTSVYGAVVGTALPKNDTDAANAFAGLGRLFQAAAVNSTWTAYVNSLGGVAKGIGQLVAVAASEDMKDVTPDDIRNISTLISGIGNLYAAFAKADADLQSASTNSATAAFFTGGFSKLFEFFGKDGDNTFIRVIEFMRDDFAKMAEIVNEASKDLDEIDVRFFESFVGFFSYFGEMFGGVQKLIDLMGIDNIDQIFDKMKGLFESAASWVVDIYDTIATRVKEGDYSQDLVDDVTTLFDALGKIGDILDKNDWSANYSTVGFDLIGAFASGFTSDLSKTFDEPLNKVKTHVTTKLNSYQSDFVTVGKFLASGLALGIRNQSLAVTNAATSMIASTIGTMNALLGIRSPSRVMAEMGGYMVEGLYVGLTNSRYDPISATEDMMYGIIDIIRDVMGIHSPSVVMQDLAEYMATPWYTTTYGTLDEIESRWQLFNDRIVAMTSFSASEMASMIEDAKSLLNTWSDSNMEFWTNPNELYSAISAAPAWTGADGGEAFLQGYLNVLKANGPGFVDYAKGILKNGVQLPSFITESDFWKDNQALIEAGFERFGPDFVTIEDGVVRFNIPGAGVVNAFEKDGDASSVLNEIFHMNGLSDLWNLISDPEAAISNILGGTGSGSGASASGSGSGSGSGGGSGGGSLGSQNVSASAGGLNLYSPDGYTIGDILNRMDRLENAITSMQVVLDSGVLVGQISPLVDQTIGGYVTLSGRWN